VGNLWPKVIGRTLGLLAGAVLLGWLIGRMTLALLAATLVILVWQLFQLYRLERWLREDFHVQPPTTAPLRPSATWKTVYQGAFRLRQRSRKRKRKLSRIIKQFRMAAAALPDAIVVLSDDDEVLWRNKAAQDLLGLSARRDIGLPVTSLVRHPQLVAFLNQRTYESSVEFPSPVNADLILSVRIKPYGKKQRLLLATDISRVHRLEQIRRDFVANVSHELRTPLTVVSGYLETLLDHDDAQIAHWQQPLRRMQQQSNRMLRIIEDLLMLSRLETQIEGPPQRPVDVPAMLRAIAEDAIALSGERGHQIHVEADQALWLIGCEQELRSAFSNLAFNAVRYTPDGGHIAIRWFTNECGAHLEVEDDGEGIAPQHIPRLTERFYRLDRGRHRERGGTGLGLAIVKHVINNHNGQLRINSLVGIGSIFTCDFPPQRQMQAKGKPSAVATEGH
jgi:two-component system phosphate regulon sensor histidine kinase PhoR